MNKKLFFSGISIISALGLLAGATYALTPVSASAPSGTFSVGTPGMEICNDVSGVATGCAPSIASPINLTDLAPGIPETFTFWLENASSGVNDGIGNITGTFATTNGNGRISVGGTLENDLNVGVVCNNSLTGVATTTFNTWEAAQSFGTGTLVPTPGGDSVSQCVMTVELPSANTTDAGQSLNFNAVFNGSVGSSATPTPTP